MNSGQYFITHRDTGSDVAIVMIHGFSGDARVTWGEFPRLLMDEPTLERWDVFSIGYDTSLSIDVSGIWTANPEIVTLGGLLKTVLDVPPLDRRKAIAFLAHSMGGLMLQRGLLLMPTEMRQRVGHVLMYGTPSGGLQKARGLGALLNRQARDMELGGAFVTSLRDDWKAAFGERRPFKLFAIAGDRDEFVPRSSSLDPFPEEVRHVVYGNHLQIVKPDGPAHLGFKIAVQALTGAGDLSRFDSARVAVEARQFSKAIEQLLPRANELDDDGLVLLALALDSENRRSEAIEILNRRHGRGTDPLGVLGGRLKRRWLVERTQADGDRALACYRDGYKTAAAAADHDQAYYHAINVAFMELLLNKDAAAARANADRALDHCSRAADNVWRIATEGEAYLYRRENDRALERYGAAQARTPDPWKALSMYQQAYRVAEHFEDEALTAALDRVFGAQLPQPPVSAV